MNHEPEYGPRGYLPERAAKRARKIVLRERMGLGWPIAAALAAVLVLFAGAAYVLARAGPPAPPFERLAPLDAVDPRGVATLDGYLVVRAGGPLRVFVAPAAAVEWCAAAGQLESAAGAVWSREGFLLGGDAGPLPRVPAEVHAGDVYVDTDPAHVLPPPTVPVPGTTPACD